MSKFLLPLFLLLAVLFLDQLDQLDQGYVCDSRVFLFSENPMRRLADVPCCLSSGLLKQLSSHSFHRLEFVGYLGRLHKSTVFENF
jgi:hypothetical protein